MSKQIRVFEVTRDNYLESPCCGIKNTEHKGHRHKSQWTKAYLDKGLRIKLLLDEKSYQVGYIEYLPGEYAWRGVIADGYMFIHCLWTFYKQNQRKGYGSQLIHAAINDAKKERMNGVAAMARKKPWLASKDIFLKNGFTIVDTAPPDHELLVMKFKKTAPDPKFKTGWEKKLEKYARGLTIIRSNQCPHVMKFADDIAEMSRDTYKLNPKIVELKTHREAQNAPTPYAVFSIIYNGKVIADHQVSRSRFRNIMNKLPGVGPP